MALQSTLAVNDRLGMYGSIALVVLLALFIRPIIQTLENAKKLLYYHFITPAIRDLNGKRIPGPGPLSETRFARFDYQTDVTRAFAKTYGGVYLVYNDTVPELALADPVAIQAYFSNDGRVHAKSPGMGFGYYFFRLLGHAVGTKHNEDWFRIRRVVDPHFTNGVVKNLLPKLSSDFAEWFDQLDKHPRRSTPSTGGKNDETWEMDVLDVAERTPFKVVCRALFDPVMTDKDVDHLLKLDHIHAQLVQTAFFGKIEQYWLYRYLPTAANKRMDDWDRNWARILKELVFRAREEGTPNAISQMYESVEEGKLTEFELWQTLDEILYTNIDVTSSSLSWSIILMSQPDTIRYQDLVREEIHKALYSDDEKWGAGLDEETRICNYLYRTNTLIHGCVLEQMRLVPLLYYALPEVTAEAKIIGGYKVPSQTSVLIDAAALNRRAPIWQPDGETYRPERFINLDPLSYRYSLWRFGMGPRKCVGQFFADKIVKGFLFHALRKHRFEVVGNVTKKTGMFVQVPEGKVRVRRISRV